MSRIKPKHRRLQFSLRSVLLLMLAVALWLGYEVRQSRRIERAIAGLHAIGGDAECEPTAWSLLRLCRIPGYGQRIVRAEIPGDSMEQAIELLRGLSGLREVQVSYDGTYDPTPSWQLATKELGDAVIAPRATEDDIFDPEWIDPKWLDEEKWKSSVPLRRLARIRARVVDVHPRFSTLRLLLLDSEHSFMSRKARYKVVLLPEGILAEVLIDEDTTGSRVQHAFAVLVIEDKCAGVRGFSMGTRGRRQQVVMEDLDRDGLCDLGFYGGAPRIWRTNPGTRKVPGDARDWLGAYKITRDGFKSLLPTDRSDFP